MDYSIVIISGMSGAGKSCAVKALEDVGFFCIDNMPTALILKLLEMSEEFFAHNKKLACVIDIRNGENSRAIMDVIGELKSKSACQIIFLDAGEKVLIDRYKETRRRHPLMFNSNLTLEEAVQKEKELMMPVHEQADYVVDTSLLSTAQLKDRILSCVISDKKQAMTIDIMSFGFKFGVPSDADLVFDVRCLKNPFYVKELRPLTGNDERVKKFVFEQESSIGLLDRQMNLLDFSLPLYLREGKSHLTIAYGCTGGKHRSVAFANAMYSHINGQGYTVSLHHRDITREVKANERKFFQNKQNTGAGQL